MKRVRYYLKSSSFSSSPEAASDAAGGDFNERGLCQAAMMPELR